MISNSGPLRCAIKGLLTSKNSHIKFPIRTIRYRSNVTPGPPKINKKIGFIGDGNMAKAISHSIVQKGLVSFTQIYVSGPDSSQLDIWLKWKANPSTDNCVVAEKADIIFLAVKPDILPAVVKNMSERACMDKAQNKLFVSVLAGITVETLEDMFSTFKGSRIIRTMPNISMMVGESCIPYCLGRNVTEEDLAIIKLILDVTGISQQVPESMINAVGALTGSGPAFVFLMIEALSDGAVKAGVNRDTATKFAAQTVLGAAKMVLETKQHPGELKDQVCSAKGTTIAGIHALERGRFRGALMDAVESAAKRANELSLEKRKTK